MQARVRALAHVTRRALSAQPETSPRSPNGLSVGCVFELPSNRAFRYVFDRTLPLRTEPEFSIHEQVVNDVVKDIHEGATRVIERHLYRVTDQRAAVHIHAAALAISTHHVLNARLRGDTDRPMKLLRTAFGVGDNANKLPTYWIGKAALLFAPDKMAAVRNMTTNAERDFGDTFHVSRDDDDGGDAHHMTVSKCFYADVCRDEGVPNVAGIFCALDRALFSHVSPRAHGISFDMSPETLATEPPTPCRFSFRRAPRT